MFGLIKNLLGFSEIRDSYVWFISWNLISVSYSFQNILRFINAISSHYFGSSQKEKEKKKSLFWYLPTNR